jgi:hypothetical protein
MPGEIEYRTKTSNTKFGINLDKGIVEAVEQLGSELKIPIRWEDKPNADA